MNALTSPTSRKWTTRLSALALAAASFIGASLLPASTVRADDAKPLTVGFIYVGSHDDYGYNQAQAEGAAELKKEVPGLKILEAEQVPETVAVQKTMESMIELNGASAIFATSYGYFDPHVIKMARKFPNVHFFHCGGMWNPKLPANISTYFGYIDECEYIAGICAGKATKSNKLGFIAAKPIPQVLRNINAFELGAKSVNPAVTTTVVFTGDWFMPVKEAEAANSLIDQGIDVLTCHVDSPKVILQTAEKRGIYCCGYHANGSALAPKGYLTGSEWNWSKVFVEYIHDIQEGKTIPHLIRGGLKDGIVKMSPYGPAVSEETKKLADAAKEEAMEGKMVIFKGPLKDNTGATVIPEGKEYVQTDPTLEGMNYLVEGVIGSAGGK